MSPVGRIALAKMPLAPAILILSSPIRANLAIMGIAAWLTHLGMSAKGFCEKRIRSGGRSETRFLVPYEPEVAGCKVFFRGQRGSLARKTGFLGPLVNGYRETTVRGKSDRRARWGLWRERPRSRAGLLCHLEGKARGGSAPQPFRGEICQIAQLRCHHLATNLT